MKKVTDKEYRNALDVIKRYREQIDNEINDCISYDMNISTFDIEMTIGLRRALWSYEQTILNLDSPMSLEDLRSISVKKFKSIRNVGTKTLLELYEICSKYGITLKP